MRVLSWDVGLRTLSYCLLKVEEGQEIVIEQWESVDVQTEFNPPQTETEGARPRKTSTAAQALRPRSPKMTLEESVKAVHQALERRRPTLVDPMPDVITIEQQPAGGQNRFSSVNMKVISHVIQAYFYNLFGDRCVITFVSPASKLTELRSQQKEEKQKEESEEKSGVQEEHQEEGQEEAKASRKAMGQRYRTNKQFAVQKTRELLTVSNDVDALATLEAAGKKKDDLCDAFLLGYYYAVKVTTAKKKKPPAKKRRSTTTKVTEQAEPGAQPGI